MEIELIFLLLTLVCSVAFLHSSVGLGGGSSYTALFAVWGLSSNLIPPISLSLNLIVSSIGAYNFIKQKHGSFKLIAPFLISSTPFAYIGGLIELPKKVFFILLACSLILVIYRLIEKPQIKHWDLTPKQKLLLCLTSGALLGLLSGLLGIGGGIYLVPLIILFGLGNPKQAAACGAIFIWFNSMSGLIARVINTNFNPMSYWPLFIAVIIGGSLGSHLGASKFNKRTIEKLLALTLTLASLLLIKKSFY
jgi:uncharacterized membrane protein YfcA